MRFRRVGVVMIWAVLASGATTAQVAPATAIPEGFVHLKQIDSSILQEIRYATTRNFTGAPVPGYAAAECILMKEVAEALKRAQDALRPRGYSLKVYDCYRPLRAVRAFVEWGQKAEAPGDERYYPRTKRQKLVPLGYIAEDSSHAKGIAVDITIAPLKPAPAPIAAAPAGDASCIAVAAHREPDDSVDMGTGYDCFDELSHTAHPAIRPAQARMRRILVQAMAAQDFKNFNREWWHFTYAKIRGAPKSLDFEVTAP